MNKKLLAVIFGAGLMLAACGGGNDKANETNTTTDTGTQLLKQLQWMQRKSLIRNVLAVMVAI